MITAAPGKAEQPCRNPDLRDTTKPVNLKDRTRRQKPASKAKAVTDAPVQDEESLKGNPLLQTPARFPTTVLALAKRILDHLPTRLLTLNPRKAFKNNKGPRGVDDETFGVREEDG